MDQLFVDQPAEWRNSLRLMRKLRQEIDQGLEKSCAELRLNEFIEGLLDKYAISDVSFVIKSVVAGALWDGRYNKSSKEWAKDIEPFPQPPGRAMDVPPFVERFFLNAHPCCVNQMANRIIKLENSIAQTKDDRMMGNR